MMTLEEVLDAALACHRAGLLQDAERLYRQLLEALPDHADVHHLLGLVAHDQGRHEEAIGHLGRAVALDPDRAEFHHNLGQACQTLGRHSDAIACYQRAVLCQPDLAESHHGLATAWHDLDRLEEAADSYQWAIRCRPDLAEAHNNLGNLRQSQGKLDEAVACYTRAIQVRPDYANAHNGLGVAAQRQGRLDLAIDSYRRAVDLAPDFAGARSNLLYAVQFHPGVTLSELRLAHAEYEHRHAAPLRAAWLSHQNSRDPQRPLRLGFVSSDLVRHPVGFFLIGLLENLDRRAAETVCYCDRRGGDDLTARLEASAKAWRSVVGISDQSLADLIREDRIDILFDLAGHTSGNRLLVFARKPAPVQITWAGYAGTTGLAAIDYLLADRWEVPPEAEPYYAERVLRMPDGYVCYSPPADAPAVGPLPALASGRVSLGSFNNPVKITAPVMACWAEILRRVPQARLVLRYGGLDEPGAQERLRRCLADHGIPADRLHFLGYSPNAQMLAGYNQIDLALDTFPYSGGLTTCEALWMGVPVVACPGETFAGRHSLSHLSNVGLVETIAATPEEYVKIAIALASDLPRLAALRAGLRQRVSQSPLCDGKRFAENLARVLRDVWRQWVAAGDK